MYSGVVSQSHGTVVYDDIDYWNHDVILSIMM